MKRHKPSPLAQRGQTSACSLARNSHDKMPRTCAKTCLLHDPSMTSRKHAGTLHVCRRQRKQNGCGSKSNRRGYAGFGRFHLPGFHFATGFLSHRRILRSFRSSNRRPSTPPAKSPGQRFAPGPAGSQVRMDCLNLSFLLCFSLLFLLFRFVVTETKLKQTTQKKEKTDVRMSKYVQSGRWIARLKLK